MIDETSTTYWKDVYDQVNTNTKFNAPSGYVLRKGYDPRMEYHSLNYEETPSVVYRYAEVLLNYAEAKFEKGEFNQGVADATINKLRVRAKIASMTVSEINDSFDLARDPSVAPVLWEIRRERMVELMGEGFGFYDIRRWKKRNGL